MPGKTAIKWRAVPGWPGYTVSTDGRVRGPSGKDLRQATARSGHLYVQGRIGGRTARNRKLYVHRAMLAAFVGPCPEGMETRHVDGDPANNVLANLAWGSRLEQRDDDRRNGVHRGKAQALSPDTAREIRALRGSASARKIGALFGVSHTAVLRIWRGKVWNHV